MIGVQTEVPDEKSRSDDDWSITEAPRAGMDGVWTFV